MHKSIEILSAKPRVEPNTFDPYIIVALEIYPLSYQNDKIPIEDIEKYMGEDIIAAIKQNLKKNEK